MKVNILECCGIHELANIYENEGKPERTINSCFNEGVGAFAVFSSVGGEKTSAGAELAAYIEQHGLGTVVRVGRKRNPNTGNQLTVWVWEINQTALKRWGRKHYDRIQDELDKEIQASYEKNHGRFSRWH